MSNGTGYRRGSVFGGLMLIALGALFLLANLDTQINPLLILARYWPVLLIFWGFGKLVDYFMLRDSPQAADATRLTAGDIIGLLFIIILGTVITQAGRLGGILGDRPGIRIGGEEFGCLFGREFEFTQEAREAAAVPRGQMRLLTVDADRGDVTVTGGASGEVSVSARKKVCAQNDAEAQRLASAYEPALEATSDGYTFRWRSSAGARGSMSADLDLQVPAGYGVKLTTRRGDVRVSNLTGGAEISLSSGKLNLQKVGGDVRVGIRNGSVSVAEAGGSVRVDGRGDEVDIRNAASASLEGEFFGPLRFTAIRGPVRFLSRRTDLSIGRLEGGLEINSGRVRLSNVPGDVSLDTRDKEIEMEDVAGEVRIENRNGSIEMRFRRAPAQPIQIENDSGSIDLTLPAASGFQISASARNGDIETDFESPALKLEEKNGDESLTGAYGNGRVSIRLSTRHGTIHLRRTTAGD
jgi:hypothetical protein